jgi:hypothetical protein
MRPARIDFFHFAALLALTAGCGGNGVEMGSIAGVVTLDGKPVKEAVINFTSTGNRSARGIVTDGQIVDVTTFEVNDGAPVGKQTVVVLESYSSIGAMSPGAKISLTPVTKIPPIYSQLS